MSLQLGALLPDFEVETTYGPLKLYDYQGESWLLFFSHPADFTPVCTTELARLVALLPEFNKRRVKLIAISCDTVDDHSSWGIDIMAYCDKFGEPLPFPIIADPKRELAVYFGMLDPAEKNAKTGFAEPCRSCFVFGPDKTLRLSTLYPSPVGRDFSEVIRSVDALQLNQTERVVTPVDWCLGDKVIVPPGALTKNYPNAIETVQLPSGKEYLRYTTVNKN